MILKMKTEKAILLLKKHGFVHIEFEVDEILSRSVTCKSIDEILAIDDTKIIDVSIDYIF